jgi:hypothetical protein
MHTLSLAWTYSRFHLQLRHLESHPELPGNLAQLVIVVTRRNSSVLGKQSMAAAVRVVLDSKQRADLVLVPLERL